MDPPLATGAPVRAPFRLVTYMIKGVEGRRLRARDSQAVSDDPRRPKDQTGSLTQRALLSHIAEPPSRRPRRLEGGWSMG